MSSTIDIVHLAVADVNETGDGATQIEQLCNLIATCVALRIGSSKRQPKCKKMKNNFWSQRCT